MSSKTPRAQVAPKNRRNPIPAAKAREHAEFAARLNAAFDLDGVHPLARPGIVAQACEISLYTAMRYLSGRSMPAWVGRFCQLSHHLQVCDRWLLGIRPEMSAKTARFVYQSLMLSPADKARVGQLFFAYNNGSRRAQQLLMATDLPIAQRAVIYEATRKAQREGRGHGL
ncbi:hypothetical protein SAMN02949497_3247 [Methylomagnum ishizawai]|uniref:Uncharacterized protein n=1 Tax=Methylomagnum ishizawai TaxID=1760988 RepID=A0A1Y6CZV3_9GAMM|nr:hypothetical protein [Methylomagnum ishizawai]SMF95871.1 hypothetical protein SAMN02949497_3247 [Methylomagnum ishizawai]